MTARRKKNSVLSDLLGTTGSGRIYRDLSASEKKRAAKRELAADRQFRKRQAMAAKKQERADKAARAKYERSKSKETKLAEALQKKYEASLKKSESVPAKRRMSDKGILAELMRENPKGRKLGPILLYSGPSHAQAIEYLKRAIATGGYVGLQMRGAGGTWKVAADATRNPAKFDRCVKKVKAKGGATNAYAVCTAAGTRRRKKNPADASAEVFEEFHGYPSEELVTVEKKVHVHKHLAAAGELRKLEVWGVDDKGHKITGFKGALLCFNEAKNQLFVEGGDQSINLKDFGITRPHELETLGQLVSIDYFTRKDHLGDEGGEAVYEHRLRTTNENGKHVVVDVARYPDLIYRVLDEQFEFSGGSYLIRAEGIDK